MKPFFLTFYILALVGCRFGGETPNGYLARLMSHPEAVHDGFLEYKLYRLPLDYFVAKKLLIGQEPGASTAALREEMQREYGKSIYFLLQIRADSTGNGSPIVREELKKRMLLLQEKQESARLEIAGLLGNRNPIHPGLLSVSNDWISKDAISLVFCFDAEDAADLEQIDLGKSIVYSRNLTIDARKLEPNFRLKDIP